MLKFSLFKAVDVVRPPMMKNMNDKIMQIIKLMTRVLHPRKARKSSRKSSEQKLRSLASGNRITVFLVHPQLQNRQSEQDHAIPDPIYPVFLSKQSAHEHARFTYCNFNIIRTRASCACCNCASRSAISLLA